MFNYFLYLVGQFIAIHLPREKVYRLAVAISDLHYIFAFRDRKAVQQNLEAIFPGKDPCDIRRIRLNMFRNFAKYLVDFFRFSKIDRKFLEENIRIKNQRYLDEALAKKKGVIIVSAHIGNWELGGAVVGILGYPFWVVALPHKHKRVTDFFNRQRESKGIKVIPLGKAVRRCIGVLKENKILGLVGDRDFTEKGLPIDFFGRPAIFPEGPANFSLKLGSIILPTFSLRNPDDSFTFIFEKPIEFSPSGDNVKDTLELITKYKVIFEDYIRRYPDQWYIFRRFWKE